MTRLPVGIAATTAAVVLSLSSSARPDDGQPTAEIVVQPAIDGIFAAFESYPLVGLGDAHGLAQGMDFYAELVRDPRFARDVGNVVVEFGASGRQNVLDRYLAGETVPYTELRTVWTDTVGWIPTAGNLGFAKFFAAVREVNTSLAPDQRIRVWLGEPPIDWATATPDQALTAFRARDTHPAHLIVESVLAKGEKALVIYGFLHFGSGDLMRGLVEAEHPGVFFVAVPYTNPHHPAACAPLLERAAEVWPTPALAAPARDGAPEAVLRECASWDSGSRVIQAEAVLFYGPLDALVRSPGLPDIYLDADYRLAVHRRSEIGRPALPLRPFREDFTLRRADYEVDLDAPGFPEAVDAMFAEHDRNADGVVTASEHVDPIPPGELRR